MSSDPVGVFDSGVGGLSVLREIRSQLPQEDLLYVADSGYAPYGDKSEDFIEARSIAVTEFLVKQKAKAVVVACNTATGVAVEKLRARFPVPIVAMEPALKPATEQTLSGVVGVMATSRTLSSVNFKKLLARFGTDTEILTQPCPGLVDQVESGDFSGERTRILIEKYLSPLLLRGVDTIVLGCTHYPFLIPVIEAVAGTGINIIDPAGAVARQLSRRLKDNKLLSNRLHPGEERFWTSGSVEATGRIISQLWKPDLEMLSLPREVHMDFGAPCDEQSRPIPKNIRL